nr:GtrA family protein [uncultured Actinotalea sp.]
MTAPRPVARGPRERLLALARRPLVVYLAIGGLSYVVDAGLLYLLVTAGAPLWAAASVGYWTSVVLNFALNRSVFRADSATRWHRQAVRYGVLLVVNFAATLMILQLGEAAGVPVLVSKTAAVVLTAAWNFVLYRVWVFR